MTIRATTLSKPLSNLFWKQKKTRVYIFTQRACSSLLSMRSSERTSYYFTLGVVIPNCEHPLEFPVSKFQEGKVTVYYQVNGKSRNWDDISKFNVWTKQYVTIPWKKDPKNDSTRKAHQFIEEILREYNDH